MKHGFPISRMMTCRDFYVNKSKPHLLEFIALGIILLLSGCAGARVEPGKPLRTAIEQLLLSQALDRTLNDVNLPLPSDAAILVEAVGLTRDYGPDQEYARQAIARRLTSLGFRLVQKEEEATYRIRILLQTFGIEQGITFIGIPAAQGVLFLFPVPEIALYKNIQEKAYVRWSLDVSEPATGGLIYSSPWYAASTYYNHYTVLLLVTFHRTDLELPE
jgi:hypothetical protein